MSQAITAAIRKWAGRDGRDTALSASEVNALIMTVCKALNQESNDHLELGRAMFAVEIKDILDSQRDRISKLQGESRIKAIADTLVKVRDRVTDCLKDKQVIECGRKPRGRNS